MLSHQLLTVESMISSVYLCVHSIGVQTELKQKMEDVNDKLKEGECPVEE